MKCDSWADSRAEVIKGPVNHLRSAITNNVYDPQPAVVLTTATTPSRNTTRPDNTKTLVINMLVTQFKNLKK